MPRLGSRPSSLHSTVEPGWRNRAVWLQKSHSTLPMKPTARSTDTVSYAVTTLNNGITMPWLGLGVWRVESDAEAERVVGTAIEKGYRSIDTAKIYENERGVGRAIRHCGVPREELFVTTKVWNDDVRADNVIGAFDHSLKLLGLDYVDLYLVHWPV